MMRLTLAAAATAAFFVAVPQSMAQEREAKGPTTLAEVMMRMSKQVPTLDELIARNECRAKATNEDRGYCYLQAALEQQEQEDQTRRFGEALRRLRDANLIDIQRSDAGQTR